MTERRWHMTNQGFFWYWNSHKNTSHFVVIAAIVHKDEARGAMDRAFEVWDVETRDDETLEAEACGEHG